jgi:predicted ATPase/signal transduction histidine kinase
MSGLADYEIHAELHRSGRSAVHRATREDDGAPVVLKRLTSPDCSAAEIARFHYAVELMRELDLEGVPRFEALVQHEGRPVLVTDDIGGEALNLLLHRRPLALRETLALATQVCRTLGEIHQRGVIHRDIKPANIILAPDGRVQIIDFHLSSRLPRESAQFVNPGNIEGTLAYIAPEQTGRMNRPTDYRADLYSLGATLYTCLTRRPPFEEDDPLSLVHCHLAVVPPPAHTLAPAVPEVLSDIVARLMRKAPEDRYQSAFGVIRDLERCLEALNAGEEPTRFPLGEHDVVAVFQVSPRLHGREREREVLLGSLEDVGRQRTQLVTVSGYSGVGKSRLVAELHKPMTRHSGQLAKGKFDQLSSSPYSAFIDAFSEIVQNIIAEPPGAIARWRAALNEALGAAAGVLTGAIPALELVIGQPPPVPPLGPAESRNRFQHVVRAFLHVVATAEHPLVLFIDDLQWADGGSLDLLRQVVGDTRIAHLLVLGAYRSNEVGDGHPLALTLQSISEDGVVVKAIALAPLEATAVSGMVADTVNCPAEDAADLSALVLEKTGGNPFFVDQFLRVVHSAGALQFDAAAGRWTWDLPQIRAMEITANVADLMARKVGALPTATREVLQVAACLGADFALETLATAAERSPAVAARALWPALEALLIEPMGGAWRTAALQGDPESDVSDHTQYRFQHDRVQEAAYSLIPEQERPTVHLRIGRLMAGLLAGDSRVLFGVVHHLNAGRSRMSDRGERLELARLNERAGGLSHAAGAFTAAERYLEAGLGCLDGAAWDDHHELALRLHLQGAEAAMMTDDEARMDRLIERGVAHATRGRDKAYLLDVRARSFSRGRLLEAIEVAREGLSHVGVRLPTHPTRAHVVVQLVRLRWRLRRFTPEQLAALPEATDEDVRCAQRLMTSVIAAAYQVEPNLLVLLVCRILNLSIDHGNSPESCYQWSVLGIVLISAFNDIEAAQGYGEVAHALLERLEADQFRSKIHLLDALILSHWTAHPREGHAHFQLGYQRGVEFGDLEYASLSIGCQSLFMVASGEPLPRVAALLDRFEDVIRGEAGERLTTIARDAIQKLEDPMATGHAVLTPEQVATFLRLNDQSALGNIHFANLKVAVHMGMHDVALEEADRLDVHMEGVQATYIQSQGWFYCAVARGIRGVRLSSVRKALRRFRKLQPLAPVNMDHRVSILSGILHMQGGRTEQAGAAFERAIGEAQSSGFADAEGLACVLAARLLRQTDRPRAARAMQGLARDAYSRWGAHRVVARLDAEFPVARTARLTDNTASTRRSTAAPGTDLDAASVLSASRAIASEIVLENLLRRLMSVLLENAGAQNGALLLPQGGQLCVAARADEHGVDVLEEWGTLEDADDISLSVVRFVERSGESVVLDDAKEGQRFRNDAHIRSGHVRSLICTPLRHLGEPLGVLYLENNAVSHAFTVERFDVLKVLGTQAAISIENARLVDGLEQKVEERTQQFAAASAQAQEASAAKSQFLRSMSHELRTPLNSILGYTQILLSGPLAGKQRESVETIQRSGHHLLSLINDILDMNKIEAGKLDLVLAPVHLPGLIHEVGALVRPTAAAKGLRLETRADPALPEWVEGDARRLRQVLLNLLGNAIKFTADGSVVVRADATTDGGLRLSVQDTGPGIPEDRIDAIFQAFEQAGDAAQRSKGTGLGLAITRELVRHMGGELRVESEHGEGSTFVLDLPLTASSPGLGADAPRPVHASTPAPQSAALAWPERAELERLLALTEDGDLMGVSEALEALLAADPELEELSTRLLALIRDFDDMGIESLLREGLEATSTPG